jgi:RNA polymerase sigma-70 factor (ECF subfamily)
MNGQTTEETRADAALLGRIIARDPAAVADLYDRHARLLFGLILRILRDRSEAEEVLQEVFLSVWTRAETYDATLGSPAGWLVRIARNRGIDRLRANAVRTRTLEAVQPGGAGPGLAEETRVEDNPESSAARSEQQRGVLCALGTLPAEQRELIEHAYFLGLTHSELAARFGLPLGTVKTRVRTGMKALRQQLSRDTANHE